MDNFLAIFCLLLSLKVLPAQSCQRTITPAFLYQATLKLTGKHKDNSNSLLHQWEYDEIEINVPLQAILHQLRGTVIRFLPG